MCNPPSGAMWPAEVIVALFAFLAEAIAGTATKQTPGARHALLIYASAPSLKDAEGVGASFLERYGWTLPVFKQGKEVNADTGLLDDETMRAAAEDAVEHGCAMIVYADALPPNS